jgi:cyclopropane fatty-acyl-phospholipid synthase-like methyltransferase
VDEDPKRIVERGYDAIAEEYGGWADSFETPERRWVDRLLEQLDDGARVLDLGCGGGRAAAQAVAAHHRYVGVDISSAQLRRARRYLPSAAELIHADAVAVQFEPDSFDAVVSLFMTGHIPRGELEPLFTRVFGWLRGGGWLLTTLGTSDTEEISSEEWFGVPMFFAGLGEEANRALLESIGFEPVEARVVPFEEPGHGLARFMWVLARKPH